MAGAAALLSSALLLLCLACAAAAQGGAPGATDLCYEVAWDLANAAGPQRRIIRPVTAFPAEHALVKDAVCGRQFAEGDRIPARGAHGGRGRGRRR